MASSGALRVPAYRFCWPTISAPPYSSAPSPTRGSSANAHAGDDITLWGFTPGTALTWTDGLGATGYTGLTLTEANGASNVTQVTLAGYAKADFTDGRLTVTTGAVAGTSYLNIALNG